MSNSLKRPHFWKVKSGFVNLSQVLWIEVQETSDRLQVKLLFVERAHDLYDEDGRRLLEYLDRIKVGPTPPERGWDEARPVTTRM